MDLALSFVLCLAAATDAPPASAPASAPVATECKPLADWLVHIARHHGHLKASTEPRRATLHALALMQAATTLDPVNAEAWLWSYDLLSRMGREADALDALTHYIALSPRDESAALQHVALSLAGLQTAEARGAWIQKKLKEPALPRSVQSDLHRRLAEFFRERGDSAEASRQIEQALRRSPMNLAARELAYDMFGETEPLLQRVELALQITRINPSQVNVLWELGELLDGHALHAQAQEWFSRALEIHRRASGKPVPPDYWLGLASSYASSGDYGKCLETVQFALDARPTDARGRLLRAYAAQRSADADPAHRDERQSLARVEIDRVAAQYEARIPAVLRDANAAAAAELAWFFAFTRPDKEKAAQLAAVAMKQPYPDTLARRAFGYSLLLNGDAAKAAEQFKPLAEGDQFSGLGLARAHLMLHQRGAAVDTLHRAANLRFSGMAFDQICRMLADLGEQPPARPDHAKVLEALDRFDRRVLDFHKAPSDTLRLTVQFIDDPLPSTGPCRLRVKLQNVNPPDSFAVTLGEGLMVRPRVVLSATLGENDVRRYPAYTEVLLNERPVLMPGESIEKVVDIDVGEVCEDLLATVTKPQTLEVAGLLDPVRGDAGMVAGLGSVHAAPARATRAPIPSDEAALTRLVEKARAAEPASRIDAARAMGALLAARQRRMTVGDLSAALEKAGIEDALLDLCRDADPCVRGFALDAAGWGRMEPHKIASRVSPELAAPQPHVRLLAARLCARSQPKSFENVLRALAGSDPDPAVRLMALSFTAVEAPLGASAAAPSDKGDPEEPRP